MGGDEFVVFVTILSDRCLVLRESTNCSAGVIIAVMCSSQSLTGSAPMARVRE